MTSFVASNGVELIWCGCVSDKQPGDGCEEFHKARKEFYQNLRDKELGRWRDPEAPNFVVYPRGTDEIVLMNETTGLSDLIFRSDDQEGSDPESRAARRYFAAHPEPKPWHNAKPGEAWVLAAHDDADEYPYVTDSNGRFIDENFVTHKPEDFVSGRRIWPEGDSDG